MQNRSIGQQNRKLTERKIEEETEDILGFL